MPLTLSATTISKDEAKQVFTDNKLNYTEEKQLVVVKTKEDNYYYYPSGRWRRGNKMKYYTSKTPQEFIDKYIKVGRVING